MNVFHWHDGSLDLGFLGILMFITLIICIGYVADTIQTREKINRNININYKGEEK